MEELTGILNTEGQIIVWPAKPKRKQAVLEYLATKFETNKIYSEKEINNIIDKFHTFNDAPLLRRELFEKKFLNREKDGSRYWKAV